MGPSSKILMPRFQRRKIFISCALLAPFLTLAAPSWFTIAGIGPNWVVLWLLPWALEDGPLSGAVAGLYLGLVLDGITLGEATHIPAFIALGFWWGRLGRRGPSIERSLNLGLLALLGSALVGLSLWVQIIVVQESITLTPLYIWGMNTLLAQAIITGLLAPIVCSWFLLLSRRKRTSL